MAIWQSLWLETWPQTGCHCPVNRLLHSLAWWQYGSHCGWRLGLELAAIALFWLASQNIGRGIPQSKCILGPSAIWDIHPKLILNWNLTQYRLSITPVLVVESFCNFAQSTAVTLPCSVQNYIRIGKQDFTRFEFQMHFRPISYIAQPRPWTQVTGDNI